MLISFGIFFILGLIIGSFLNVVIVRLRAQQSLLGRSRCVHCARQIAWYDNVPLVSFVILRGRCRHCAARISIQYPLVEFLTGAIFALVGMVFFVSPLVPSLITTALLLAISACFVVIFIYDLRFLEIPMIVAWIAIVASILLAVVWGEGRTLSFFASGAGAFLFFFTLTAISQERWMGKGDAYVALAIGSALGWPLTMIALLFAFCFGALVSIILLIFSRVGLKSQIPFAPFLIGGFFVALLLKKMSIPLFFLL